MSDKPSPPDGALARLARWLFPPKPPVPTFVWPPSLPAGRRLAAPPAPKVVSPPSGVVFRECPTCFCLLVPERSENHAAWHKGIAESVMRSARTAPGPSVLPVKPHLSH